MNLIAGKSRQTHLRPGLSIAISLCLFLGSCELSTDFGLSRPLLAQASDKTHGAPSGWFLAGSKPASYRTGVDKTIIHEGQPSAYLLSAVPTTGGFGTLMQSIDA